MARTGLHDGRTARDLLAGALWRNRSRLALSIAAVAAGVALGLAVQLINGAAVDALSHAVRMLSGEADFTVRGPRAGFDQALYPRVAALPEVASASPAIELDARVAGHDLPLKLIGVDVFRAVQVQPALIAEFDEPLDALRADMIVLNAAAARRFGVDTGDEITLHGAVADVTLTVAAILEAESEGQALGVMDIAAVQWRFGRLTSISRIDLRLRDGVDAAAFQRTLQARLPPGVFVARPEVAVRAGADATRAYRVNLDVLALVALFTGALVVFSTQAMALVRRRGEIALLRVLGVTRAGIAGLIALESAAIGAVGSALGLALGYLLAAVTLRVTGADLGSGQFEGLQGTLNADPALLALYFALGTGAAMVGGVVPAVEAASAQPAPTLGAGDEQRLAERLGAWWPGAVLIAAGLAAPLLPPVGGLPLPGYAAIALLLGGSVSLMPRVAGVALRLAGTPTGAPLQLAVAQLRGSPAQAAAGLAASVAAVSLVVAMAIMVASFRSSLDRWLDDVLPAQIYLRTSGQGETAHLSAEQQRRVQRLPGVQRVEFVRSQQILLDPARPRVTLLARPVDAADPGARAPLVTGFVVPERDKPPPVYVTEAIADLYGMRVGERVELPVAGKRHSFTVAGVWRDFARQHGAILMDRELYVRLTGDTAANDAALWLDDKAVIDDVRRAIAQLPGAERLEVADRSEIRTASLAIFDRTFAVTYALEAVAVVIALFGLSASVGAQVLARRREFGMLRHLGMTRAQIAAMLAGEGALLSATGLAAGLVLGWGIGLILIHVVNRQSFHWSMDLHAPWLALAGFVVAMLLLSTLTAVASGRQAMAGDAVAAVKEDW